jgi:tetratricopeptide (TPR) repeat protein
MKKTIYLAIGIIFSSVSLAQEVQRYENDRGESHICGVFQIEELMKDSIFQKWYSKNYLDFEVLNKKQSWTKGLKNIEVVIYLGTWCGDSKKWVPRFLKLWDELGLKRTQLTFIGVFDFIEGKYKQGPNGEEKGKSIHRVPTFIFKRDGKETARIIESPNTDLETDLAQIALGFPSNPNYRGATRMIELIEEKSSDAIKTNTEYLNEIYGLVKSPSELNTLGYVYLESDRVDEALTILYYNTRFYKYNPNVYDSYAEALMKAGQTEEAIKNYEKVLLLDRSNNHAKEQIKKLKNNNYTHHR